MVIINVVLQLENTLGGEESYQLRVTQHLVPCLGQFSVAMGDDTQWKTLNYQVLLKTRHSSSKVGTLHMCRKSSPKSCDGTISKGEFIQWLTLLVTSIHPLLSQP